MNVRVHRLKEMTWQDVERFDREAWFKDLILRHIRGEAVYDLLWFADF